ncbi:hypothetical protein B0H67DRAFT_648149 [Lasiosphaeris hirsuta]|uniref:Uncharacterized protein n=1 Tax=Lasiosphaeris hirsuta TaxID=260670 RepID=A0AA40A2D2_9PEZI|nr:hypothetical protein B0H67DRAFT_648149 [Lasiosphaeris hirsuta]
MEIALAVGSLKVAYNLTVFGIKLDQVPAAVRRCLELVRTCHYDLEALIKLRNEYLPLLETKSAILERINTIIENAHKGLLEVARLVEKLRPEAHDGNSSLRGRLEWMFIDSREFLSQEPLVSRQHSSVIAELNFLRHLVLLTPLLDGVGGSSVAGAGSSKRPAVAWENIALLDEMLGGEKRLSASTASETPPFAKHARCTCHLGSAGSAGCDCTSDATSRALGQHSSHGNVLPSDGPPPSATSSTDSISAHLPRDNKWNSDTNFRGFEPRSERTWVKEQDNL